MGTHVVTAVKALKVQLDAIAGLFQLGDLRRGCKRQKWSEAVRVTPQSR